jgi:hypothetical protein
MYSDACVPNAVSVHVHLSMLLIEDFAGDLIHCKQNYAHGEAGQVDCNISGLSGVPAAKLWFQQSLEWHPAALHRHLSPSRAQCSVQSQRFEASQLVRRPAARPCRSSRPSQ